MIDLDNPSLLVMTEFELLATVAAFAAVAAMAVCDWLARRRAARQQKGDGGGG
jgi:hypothetical protein